MTVDGLNALKLEYNSLNLTAGVRNAANNAPLATYRWLADGTKTGVTDGAGTQGFEYIGSLIYRRNANDELELESTAFGGGRITASEGSGGTLYTPNYFIADHLGSTRAIVTPDVTGGYTIPERNNYLPFGKRWEQPNSAISDNRWLYNGKELQTIGLSDAMQFLDYGFRIYNPRLGRWTSPDPLSESFGSQTPFGYANNSPINFIDMFGLFSQGPNWLPPVTITAPGGGGGLDFFSRSIFQNWQEQVGPQASNEAQYGSFSNPVKLETVVVTAQRMPEVGEQVMRPLSGFWDYFSHYADGGRKYEYEYESINIFGRKVTRTRSYIVDKDGKIVGIAPITGIPPAVGRVGGTMWIKGLKQAVNRMTFHGVIKGNILKAASKSRPGWKNIVGNNPDIAVKNGKIVLESRNMVGKSVDTGLDAAVFFK